MNNDRTYTRRSFLKGAGCAGAAMAAGALATPVAAMAEEATGDEATAASTDAASSWRVAPAMPTTEEIAQTIDCDVLVIGMSFAGHAAFRAAAEAGASVVAMEAQTKEDYRCIGMGHYGHINSQFLAERGVAGVDVLDFFTNWQIRSANRSNQALCMKFSQQCGTAFDWMIDSLTQEQRDSITIQFYPTDESYTEKKSGISTYVGTATIIPVQNDIFANMQAAGEAAGAQILWGTAAYVLTQDADGSVTGAIGRQQDGTYVQVNAAKGVVVCAGDYSANPEMCKDLMAPIANLMGDDFAITSSGYAGDGVKLCYWAGGKLDPYQSTMGGDYYYPCDSPMDPLGSAAALWINADGKRYCNEGFGFMEWSAFQGALQPQGKIATVFDSNYEAQIKAQAPCHMAVDYPNGGLDQLPDLLAAAYAGGPEGSGPDSSPVVYAADDFETLGTYLGYEGEALENFVATIERYNEMCEAGVDEDFNKDATLLFPVANPPYYAYAGEKKLGSMLCNTAGMLIDENGQVLGTDFRPIKGLFAAGNTAGSRFGIQYTTALCGMSISFAVTQGKFTGEYVASL